MTYLSVCSGIEAATVAWHPLGWTPWAFAEVDKFPSAVLAHHYPAVPNLGDMTRFQEWPDADVDVLVGGTPCQSFSVAGLRAGLDDPRGNLMLVYLALARRYRPRWLVWENVPGVLSSDEGRAFGAFLRGLADLGYGFAYRVLDAQYFGLAQRRARVFVVGHFGDWRRAAAVLFERESLSGHPAPGREAGQDVAGSIIARAARNGGASNQDVDGGALVAFGGNNTSGSIDISTAVNHHAGRYDFESETFIAHSLRADGFDASEDGTGRGTPLVPVMERVSLGSAVRGSTDHCGNAESGQRHASSMTGAHAFDARQSDVIQYGDQSGPLDTDGHTIGVLAFDTTQMTSAANRSHPKVGDPFHPLAAGAHAPAIAFSAKDHGADAGDLAPTLRAGGHTTSHANGGVMPAIAFQSSQSGVREVETHATLDANNGSRRHNGVMSGMAVRRLTPRECERLQGFPDDYTLIPYRGKPASDGPRYKALGNSFAVPVVRWIGERIQMVDAIQVAAVAAHTHQPEDLTHA